MSDEELVIERLKNQPQLLRHVFEQTTGPEFEVVLHNYMARGKRNSAILRRVKLVRGNGPGAYTIVFAAGASSEECGLADMEKVCSDTCVILDTVTNTRTVTIALQNKVELILC